MKNATLHYIENLAEKHPDAVPIFGHAYYMDDVSIDAIIRKLPDVVREAKFRKWHGGLADACRTFCHCLFVDPTLVECYIGMTFEQLVA